MSEFKTNQQNFQIVLLRVLKNTALHFFATFQNLVSQKTSILILLVLLINQSTVLSTVRKIFTKFLTFTFQLSKDFQFFSRLPCSKKFIVNTKIHSLSLSLSINSECYLNNVSNFFFYTPNFFVILLYLLQSRIDLIYIFSSPYE